MKRCQWNPHFAETRRFYKLMHGLHMTYDMKNNVKNEKKPCGPLEKTDSVAPVYVVL